MEGFTHLRSSINSQLVPLTTNFFFLFNCITLFQSSFQSISEFVSTCRVLHEKPINFEKRKKIQTTLSFVIQSCMLKVANNNLVPSFPLYLILLDVMCFFFFFQMLVSHFVAFPFPFLSWHCMVYAWSLQLSLLDTESNLTWLLNDECHPPGSLHSTLTSTLTFFFPFFYFFRIVRLRQVNLFFPVLRFCTIFLFCLCHGNHQDKFTLF